MVLDLPQVVFAGHKCTVLATRLNKIYPCLVVGVLYGEKQPLGNNEGQREHEVGQDTRMQRGRSAKGQGREKGT